MTDNKMKTVIGNFESRFEANDAVERLVADGFDRSQMSVLISEATRSRHFSKSDKSDAKEAASKGMEGAGAGATIGGTLGAIVAGLAAVGTVAIPGVGLLAAGPIVAALAGLGAGGAAGGLVGGLVGLGVNESEAKTVEKRLADGHIVLALQTTSDRTARAKELLKRKGAEDVATV